MTSVEQSTHNQMI